MPTGMNLCVARDIGPLIINCQFIHVGRLVIQVVDSTRHLGPKVSMGFIFCEQDDMESARPPGLLGKL